MPSVEAALRAVVAAEILARSHVRPDAAERTPAPLARAGVIARHGRLVLGDVCFRYSPAFSPSRRPLEVKTRHREPGSRGLPPSAWASSAPCWKRPAACTCPPTRLRRVPAGRPARRPSIPSTLAAGKVRRFSSSLPRAAVDGRAGPSTPRLAAMDPARQQALRLDTMETHGGRLDAAVPGWHHLDAARCAPSGSRRRPASGPLAERLLLDTAQKGVPSLARVHGPTRDVLVARLCRTGSTRTSSPCCVSRRLEAPRSSRRGTGGSSSRSPGVLDGPRRQQARVKLRPRRSRARAPSRLPSSSCPGGRRSRGTSPERALPPPLLLFFPYPPRARRGGEAPDDLWWSGSGSRRSPLLRLVGWSGPPQRVRVIMTSGAFAGTPPWPRSSLCGRHGAPLGLAPAPLPCGAADEWPRPDILGRF